MTLEFGAHMSIAGGVDQAILRAEEFGMTACQLFTKNERQWLGRPLEPAVIERFHAERERTGIDKYVVHASYLINLASPKEDLRARSQEAFADELVRCDLLGIPSLVVHPGAHTGSGVDEGIRQVADSLNRVHERLPDVRTKTLLETTAGQGTTLGRTFEELAEMIDQVEAKDRVAICLDTCHIFAAGYDIRDREKYGEIMAHFGEVLGLDRLQALHLNDSKFPLGSNKDRHEAIGDGEIGLDGFRWVVNDERLCGRPGILETEKGDDGEEDRRNLATLRGLVGTA